VHDLIITGLPRSGTTLVAALVDAREGVCCLSEPQRHVELAETAADAAAFVAAVGADFAALRRELADGAAVMDRRGQNDEAVDNYFAEPDAAGVRSPRFRCVPRSVANMTDDTVLAVKHNGLFTGVLPEFVAAGRHAVLAIVRDPADAIASWQSIDMPIRHGRLPAAERFWPELAAIVRRDDLPLLDRQILVADLVLARFRQCGVQVLRYEDLVHDIGLLDTVPCLASRPVRGPAPVPRRRPPGEASRVIRDRIHTLSVASGLHGIRTWYPEHG
jgi:hypothetical protein